MRFLRLVKDSYGVWSDAKASQLSAALAYYSSFSIAPILLISITVAGFFFGTDVARARLEQQLAGLVGGRAADVLHSMVEASEKSGSSGLAAALGVALLVFAATGLFAQLKDALNTIWGVAEKPKSAVLDFVKDRASALGLVLGVGFLLLVSLVATTALAALGDWLGAVLAIPEAFVHLFGGLLTFPIVTLLFLAIFKVLPDARLAWGDLWLGALLTALLFTAGKYGLAWYLGRESATSSYGAAGSFILILLWVYYSSLILLFGASVTRVVARERGHEIQPDADAVPIRPPGREQKIATGREPPPPPAGRRRPA